MDRKKLRNVAELLARAAGTLQARKFRRTLEVRWKDLTDPVTEVDQACERLIVRGIRKAFPDHAILGEEGGVQGADYGSAPFTWIIDPLDGTVNYSHGLPIFAVSIGIWERDARPLKGRLHDPMLGAPVVGVVHAPVLGETFVAERGKGAFMNGRRIHVSRKRKALQSVLASGFSYDVRDTGENVREWTECLIRFQAVRRMGSAAVDLAFTAAGRFDGFWEYGLRPWDMAAGGLLVEEAGGLITNMQGEPYAMDKPGIVAVGRSLQKPLLEALKKARGRKHVWPPR